MSNPPPAIRAVLYTRISRKTGVSTSLTGQNAELLEYATRQGWDVVEQLKDDGRSGRKRRANANECLRMLSDGEADVLAVYSVDRWTREGLEACGTLCGVLRRSGARFDALRENLTSDSDNFELQLGIHASIAKSEGELIAARVSASRGRLAAAGRFVGGLVPWGYHPTPAPDGAGRVLTPNPSEVAVIRATIDAVLGGRALTRIARELTEAGIPTPRSTKRVASFRPAVQEAQAAHELDRGGAPDAALATAPTSGLWSVYGLRLALTSESLLGQVPTRHAVKADDGTPLLDAKGQQIMRSDVERDADGAPLERWAPIIDRTTLTRLQARLRDPRVRTTQPAATVVRPKRAARLLSGLAHCSGCGHRLYVGSAGGNPVYRCPGKGDKCKLPRASAENMERVVVETFLRLYGHLPEVETFEVVSEPDTIDALARVEHELSEAGASIILPGADTAALVKRIDVLRARQDVLRSRQATVTVERRRTGRLLMDAWHSSGDELGLDTRRQLLASELLRVELSPRDPDVARGVFDDERVRFVWREFTDGESRGPSHSDSRLLPRAQRQAAARG